MSTKDIRNCHILFYMEESKMFNQKNSLKSIEKDIRAELKKWVSASDVVTARVIIDTYNSNDCSRTTNKHGNVNGYGVLVSENGHAIHVDAKLQNMLSESKMMTGIIRAKRHLGLQGTDKVAIDVITMMAICKLPMVSNHAFMDSVVEKLIENAMLYTFS